MLKRVSSIFAVTALMAQPLAADPASFVTLSANSHVCNTESEVARLAENEQLQEMARALVEFKATKYCFILHEAPNVAMLEQQAGYIKFDYKSQVLYTFKKYISATSSAITN